MLRCVVYYSIQKCDVIYCSISCLYHSLNWNTSNKRAHKLASYSVNNEVPDILYDEVLKNNLSKSYHGTWFSSRKFPALEQYIRWAFHSLLLYLLSLFPLTFITLGKFPFRTLLSCSLLMKWSGQRHMWNCVVNGINTWSMYTSNITKQCLSTCKTKRYDFISINRYINI